jgi:NADH:ubiquinone oxidoreductase subunit H
VKWIDCRPEVGRKWLLTWKGTYILFPSCHRQHLNIFNKLGVLDYIHIPKGPNNVRFVGIFKPFRDAIKLFSIERYFLAVSDYLI